MRTVGGDNNVFVYIISYFLPGLFVIVLIKKVSLTQKYLHVVVKEDPQAWTAGGQAVHNG